MSATMSSGFCTRGGAAADDGRYDHDTGRDCSSAAAELTQLAGWQSYDTAEHGLAQRYLMQALDFARRSRRRPPWRGDPRRDEPSSHLPRARRTAVDLARAARLTAQRAGLTALTPKSLVMEAHGHAVARRRTRLRRRA